jgi:hypothetical protein
MTAMATGKSIVGAETVSGQRNIRLLLADVDGTLVTNQGQGADGGGKGIGPKVASRRHSARHHRRPAATWHEHADRASRSAWRYRRL